MKRPYLVGPHATAEVSRLTPKRPTLGTLRIFCTCMLMLGAWATALGAQPIVFDTPHFQSPVRGLPGDLLMLPGSGFLDGARAFY